MRLYAGTTKSLIEDSTFNRIAPKLKDAFVISEDGRRIAAQLGNAVWGILDASWTEKENGSRVESPKPFVIN